MNYGIIDSFQTGVAIPLFSLRTKKSFGIGEFLDLVPYAEWCSSVGLDVIQLLPVNDTGEESSPYGAKSAFALNPIFINLDSVVGVKPHLKEIEKRRDYFNESKRVKYSELYRFKLEILKNIFTTNFDTISNDMHLHRWIESNSWVRIYSTYSYLKEINSKKSWKEWPKSKNPPAKIVDTIWTTEWNSVLFYAWVQFIAESQFLSIIPHLKKMSVKIKGDIPILINEDSADVWGSREFFDLKFRAGAPPDMFSYTGQNWGFPCYNWDELEKDDFSWWKIRLAQSSKFFNAIRIDHVLGFFRIWQTPETEQTGILGFFNPYSPITKKQLLERGIPELTISYLTKPVYTKEYLCELFADNCSDGLSRYFKEVKPNEFILASLVDSERKIFSLAETDLIKDILLNVYWNKVFVSNKDDEYYPFWYYYNSKVFKNLPDHEQKIIAGLIDHTNSIQEKTWEELGKKLLSMMAAETDMLVCAEDLGVVPNCVGRVLQDLGILSLKIERWTREYHREGAPFINPIHYPRLSVCSPSCHDSSTIRGYWSENWDKENYFKLFNLSSACPEHMTEELAQKIIERNLSANSLLTIISFQDLLAMKNEMISDTDPNDERINVPGTMNDTNWTWRMGMTVDTLIESTSFNNLLRKCIAVRKNKKWI